MHALDHWGKFFIIQDVGKSMEARKNAVMWLL